MIKYSFGNSKLGDTVLVVSRPVGLSCPQNCQFLGKGCYAKQTEAMYPNTRTSAMANMEINHTDIVSLFLNAMSMNFAVRIHERGDFCHDNGKLDKDYIKAWSKAIKSQSKLPFIWTYTHKLSKAIANLPTVSVYASVHNKSDICKAKDAGFRLFAYCSEIRRKHGSNRDVPPRIDVPLLGKTLVCPEQRFGRKQVTCDKCKWCVEGKGNVVFLKH